MRVPTLTSEEWLAIEREVCKRSLSTFVKQAWSILEPATKLVWGWPLDAICEHLEAVTDGRINRLLINVPPGSMKSLLTSVFWPAWEWGPQNMPYLRFIGTSHEENLAVRDNRKCRILVKSEWFQTRWPMPISRDLDGTRMFGNTSHGVRQARAFTSMTGIRGDRVILDDPSSAFDANSDAKRAATKLAFTETLPTRVNSDRSAIVVITQRLHQEDVPGLILSMDLPYTHLCIPMEYEVDNAKMTSIGWQDPRTEEGELMFPERFSRWKVEELKAVLGEYGTAGQLQQRPSPREGGIMKPENIEVVDAIPRGLNFVRGWDLAATKDGGDWTAGAKIAMDNNDVFWIADMQRIRGGPDAVESLLVNTAKMDGAGTRISAPQDPGQAGKAQATYLGRKLFGFNFTFSTESGDKATRASPFASQVNVGNVKMLRAPWNDALVAEMRVFPNGANDDQIDSLSRAFNELQSDKLRRFMAMAQ